MVILESKKNETASKMAKFCPDCSHFEIPPPKKKQSCRMTDMRHILSASVVKTLQLIICKIHVLLCLYLFQRGPGPQPPAPPVH